LALKACNGVSYTIAQSDATYFSTANQATTYTMVQSDATLALKANQATKYTMAQVDTSLAAKANLATTYSKTEMDNALSSTNNAMALKATQSTTYTKTETDSALALKANQATTYTIGQSDATLALKADLATTYTKTQTDTALALKQATLTSAIPITVNTISCTSISVSNLLTGLACAGDATFGGRGTFTGNVTSARYSSGLGSLLYYDNSGATSATILQHTSSIQLAISATIPPLASEVIMSMDSFAGVAITRQVDIKGALIVTGDVTVTGNMSNTNSFTTNGIYYNSSYFSNQIGTGFYTPNMTKNTIGTPDTRRSTIIWWSIWYKTFSMSG
jgi:hypothetical protein